MRPMCEKCAGLYYSVVELSFEKPRFGLGTSFVMILARESYDVVIERTRSEPPTTITHENTARERPN